MIRRILLIVILAGTPVAETRAEFLFADPDQGESGASWSASLPDPPSLPEPIDSEPLPDRGFANLPGGFGSMVTTLLGGGVPTGALPSPTVHVADGGIVSYLWRDVRCRYEQPLNKGMFRPPRDDC